MIDDVEIQNKLNSAYIHSDLGLPERRTGKVRDWYSLGDQNRLIITTDRLSAFDRVITAIPYKGQVLNQLSAWWFKRSEKIIQNHMVSIPDPNAMIVKEVQPLPIEVIVRGFITGVTSTALWYRYSLGEREIYGYTFEEGMKKNQKLDQAIITPTTKGGPDGHDERLTCQEVVEKGLLEEDIWQTVQNAALSLFEFGQQIANQAGLLLVDTKYEFGKASDGSILLIDEVHTPDSSRFWKAESYDEQYEKNLEPVNFDKEFIRQAFAQLGYRGEGKPPEMPESLWVSAAARYIAIYEQLTGEEFDPGSYPVEPRLVANLERHGLL